MKRIVLMLALMAATIFSASAEEKTKTYDFGDIKSLNVGYCYQVHVTEGNSGKVKVEYDSKFEDYMKVRYNSDAKGLSITMSDNLPKKMIVGKEPRIHVYLEMNEISRLDLSGACNVTFEGDYRSDDLDIDLSGASRLTQLNIKGKSLDIECSGASKCSLTGDFHNDVDMDVSGASNLYYEGNSKELNAEISGASRLQCIGNYDKVDTECSGASKLCLEGTADNAEFDGSGASSIEAKNFVVKDVKLALNGASKADVNATGSLTYNVGRASKIIYYGDAILKNVSTDSNVVRGRL